MIVKMSKLSVLIYHKEKESFLKSLQELGIIDIAENPEVDSPEALSESFRTASRLSRSCDRVIQILDRVKAINKPDIAPIRTDDIDKILADFDTLEKEKEGVTQQLGDRQKEIKLLAPWGNFDPDVVKQLTAKGLKLRFFETNEKKFTAIQTDGFYPTLISSEKSKVRFLIFERDEVFETDAAEEVMLPIKSLDELSKEALQLEQEIERLDQEFIKMTAYLDVLNNFKTENDNVAAFAEADVTLAEEAEGRVYSMTGWFPTDRDKIIASFLDNFTCYYNIESPDLDDNVPILLKNNRFSRLFEPITNIYALPSYWEIDPTPFFAPFFALYFGLCLGDLGYGAITFGIAFSAFMLAPKQFRNFAVIGMILGGLTMMAGIALNSFFGQPIFYLQGNTQYFFKAELGESLSFLGSFINAQSLTEFPAMGFAVVLGVIQVLLGIVLQCANRIRQNGIVWGIHPASFFMIIVGILFAIGHGDSSSGFKGITGIDISTYQLGALKIGSWLTIPGQSFGLFLAVAGLVLMFLFNNPDKRIIFRPLFGLWELYGFATAIVGDILSYLRLFALGLASGLLAFAFNGIALKFIANGLFPGIFATVALLVFAHTLNFGLAALGSFVHPLRLTFVEFYKWLDFEGGGQGYTPFAIEKNGKG